jgi:hypothetical protein
MEETEKILVDTKVLEQSVESSLPIDSPVQKQKVSKRLIVTVFGVIIIIIIAVSAFFWLKPKNSSNLSNNVSPTSTVSENMPSEQTQNWVLSKKSESGNEAVLTFPKTFSKMIYSSDYLIYGTSDYSKNVQVFSYNIKTREKKNIYNQEERNDFQGSIRNSRYVSDIQVLNNTLFFSIGGYMTDGATFWIDLPFLGQVQKLIDGPNGSISFWKNKYWLNTGEGDGCGGFGTTSIIDLKTKKVTKIADLHFGCLEGEELIDIDKKERAIMAFHTSGTGEGGVESNGIYQYVTGIPLNNPTEIEGIIAKQDMPSGINSIVYILEADQLVLKGKTNYFYDFFTKTISKAEVIPTPTPLPTSAITPDNPSLDLVKKLNLPSEYQLVLK